MTLPKYRDITEEMIGPVATFSVVEVLRTFNLLLEINQQNSLFTSEKQIGQVLCECTNTMMFLKMALYINSSMGDGTICMKKALEKKDPLIVDDILLQIVLRLYLNVEVLLAMGFEPFKEQIHVILH